MKHQQHDDDRHYRQESRIQVKRKEGSRQETEEEGIKGKHYGKRRLDTEAEAERTAKVRWGAERASNLVNRKQESKCLGTRSSERVSY